MPFTRTQYILRPDIFGLGFLALCARPVIAIVIGTRDYSFFLKNSLTFILHAKMFIFENPMTINKNLRALLLHVPIS